MKVELNGNTLVGEKDFASVQKNQEKNIAEAREWAKKIIIDNDAC